MAKLGLRQRVLNALPCVGSEETRGLLSTIPPELNPTVITAPCVHSALVDATTQVGVALALAQEGFVVCTGGLDTTLLRAAEREASELYAGGAMKPGRGVEVDRGNREGEDNTAGAGARQSALAYGSFHTMGREWEKEGEDGERERGSALSELDEALSDFGSAVVEQLANLSVPDTHPDLFPFGRSVDGSKLEVSQVVRNPELNRVAVVPL